MAAERLQKILSQAGACSRREAEELILAGRVAINGDVVTKLGTRADAVVDTVTLDGRRLVVSSHKIYAILYKPRGFVSTLSDPQGRPTIKELLPREWPRVFHVGRLDFQTEGLLIVTNDGEFAERVAHPRYGCPKVYLAKVSGIPSDESLQRVRSGVYIEGVRTAPARAELVRTTRRDGNTWVRLTLTEGRSREVRKLMKAVGHLVSKLKRVRIGGIEDRGLGSGAVRELTPREVSDLKSGRFGAGAPAEDATRSGKKPGRPLPKRGPQRQRARPGKR